MRINSLSLIFALITINMTSALGMRSVRVESGRMLYDDYACADERLEMSCDPGHVLVLETATYGRAVQSLARLCRVPFAPSCAVDVHFLLNRACAGHKHCSLTVDTDAFGDPCGYKEFLFVQYRCVPDADIMRSCTSAPTAVGIEQSSVVYIASANYPDRYPIDSDCQWRIVATQQAESLHGAMSLTIIDFELDVRRGGRCHDVFTVTASTSAAETRQRAATDAADNQTADVYLRECGSLGKQTLLINATSSILMTFHAARSAIGQRGFLVRIEVSTDAAMAASDAAIVNASTTASSPLERFSVEKLHQQTISLCIVVAFLCFTVLAALSLQFQLCKRKPSSEVVLYQKPVPAADCSPETADKNDVDDDVNTRQLPAAYTYSRTSCTDCDVTPYVTSSAQQTSDVDGELDNRDPNPTERMIIRCSVCATKITASQAAADVTAAVDQSARCISRAPVNDVSVPV